MNTIGFLLMGKKGLTVLEYLRDKSPERLSNIAFVVSARNDAVEKDYFDEIRSFCQTHQVTFHNRSNVQESELQADYVFAIGWRWLVYEPNYELIILHDSLLPKYRGFNPLVTALIEGDEEIGVTAIEAQKEFDSGDIYGQQKIAISYPITVAEAITKVADLYGQLAGSLIKQISNKTLTKRKQDLSRVSYSIWRNEEDYNIEWQQPAERISRFIDAVGYPYKGAATLYNHTKIRIKDAVALDDLKIVNRVPGKILRIEHNKPVVICGEGLLQINKALVDGQKELVEFDKLRVRLQ